MPGFRAERSDHNNNAEIFYKIEDSINSFCCPTILPPFTVEEPKYHIVKLSIYGKHGFHNNLIDSFGSEGFSFDTLLNPKKGRFCQKVSLHKNETKTTVYYDPFPEYDAKGELMTYLPNQHLVFNSPSFTLLEGLVKFLKRNGVRFTVQKVEIAFDYYTANPFDLQRFLIMHVYHKSQRIPCFYVGSTFYSTDHSGRAVKAIKIYRKRAQDEDDQKCIRLELTLFEKKTYEMITKKKIPFPFRLSDLDYRQFFYFCELDYEALVKCRKNQMLAGYPLSNLSEKRRTRIEQLAWSQSASYVNGWYGGKPLMRALEQLKSADHGLENYTRFREEIFEIPMP